MKKLGYIYIALSSFFFSLIAIIGKTALNAGLKIYDMAILQCMVTVLIILMYFVFKGLHHLKIDKQQAKDLLIQGIFGSTTTTLLYYLALEQMNAGIASMLLYLYPALVSLYFIITKTKKINIVNNIALTFAILGSFMVINVFNLDFVKTPLLGLFYGILSSIAYAFFNIYADRRLCKYEPMTINFYTTLTIMICTMIINPGFFKFQFELTPQIMFYIFELAIISGILPIVFLYKGIGMIGAERASIVATSELPITLILAFLVLGEVMSMVQVFGVVLIIAAIIILQYEDKLLGYAELPNKKKGV